jgi:hypothetical protein
MAKNFEHIIHKNSSVVTDGSPKIPTSGQIEYGEIAINYAADNETISLKNSSNQIVTFSPDNRLVKIADYQNTQKVIAAALNDLNDRMGESDDAAAEIIQEIDDFKQDVEDTEEVIASALNNLDSRISTVENTPVGDANVIETVKVNGTSLVPDANKAVNIVLQGLPTVTAADNGKILAVVNGAWALVSPSTIYTGNGTPSSSQGNDGDIYIQTGQE